MRKAIGVSLVCGVLVSAALAMGGPAPGAGAPAAESPAAAPVMAEKVFLVDDFESGSIKSPREWWTFDLQKAAPVSNSELKDGDEKVAAGVGNYSLLLSGPAKSWYAGGVGTYLAKESQDLSKYSDVQLDIYGNGPGSGTLKIEVVDDDNSNWVVEADQKFKPTKDDLWSYELKVDWNGWKQVPVPFSDFVLENPSAGDGVWNPQQTGGSGGLLQMQFICLASASDGKINFNVDNILMTLGAK
ncbi:MAG: CIA30 family protein [Candidatus Saganbacteria bacterium]|nr:CIA30 family protein [Candidatus Saganbacteria bacterium]